MDTMKLRPPRLLVADDDDIVREVTKEMLRGLGMEVDAVRARGEMVDRYRRSMLADRRYDLVILGVYGLFELEGGAAGTLLFELDPDVRVLISAALPEGCPCPAPGEGGIVGYLDRPFRMQDLVRAVHEALGPFCDPAGTGYGTE